MIRALNITAQILLSPFFIACILAGTVGNFCLLIGFNVFKFTMTKEQLEAAEKHQKDL